MTIRLSAVKVYEFGSKCSQSGVKLGLIGAAVLTAFSMTFWLTNAGGKTTDHDLFTLLNIVITFVLAAIYGLGRFLLRKRTINEKTFESGQYALITDELRKRGITSARQFIAAHPDHVRCAQALSRDLVVYDPNYRKVRYQFESLIYSEDADPARIKDVIVGIVADRGIREQNSVREMLHTLLHTATPLGSGAL